MFSPGLSMSFPLTKIAPARTRATRGALTARQRSCADSMSLNAMAARRPVSRAAMATLVRCRTVAKVDSIGSVTGMKISGVAGPLAVCLWRGGMAGMRCDRLGQGRRE